MLKFGYDFVEVLSEFFKEKGVKVGFIMKVLGFKIVFRFGGLMLLYWVLVKDL